MRENNSEFSVGTDIVSVNRFRKYPVNSYSRFLKRFLSEDEFNYCIKKGDPYQHIAGRFAAKEAAIKCLNKFGKFYLKDINIKNGPDGRPEVLLRDECGFNIKIDYKIDISISHTREYATATAVLKADQI